MTDSYWGINTGGFGEPKNKISLSKFSAPLWHKVCSSCPQCMNVDIKVGIDYSRATVTA